MNMSRIRFEAGARTNWHIHSAANCSSSRKAAGAFRNLAAASSMSLLVSRFSPSRTCCTGMVRRPIRRPSSSACTAGPSSGRIRSPTNNASENAAGLNSKTRSTTADHHASDTSNRCGASVVHRRCRVHSPANAVERRRWTDTSCHRFHTDFPWSRRRIFSTASRTRHDGSRSPALLGAATAR